MCRVLCCAVLPCLQLLHRDPSKRLGSGKEGTENVKTHPFFKSMDWEKYVAHIHTQTERERRETVTSHSSHGCS